MLLSLYWRIKCAFLLYFVKFIVLYKIKAVYWCINCVGGSLHPIWELVCELGGRVPAPLQRSGV